jgi:urea carboxylase system permease
LARFGYKPTLDRTLGSFSSFAAGFSYISILTGVFQMFYAGYGAGGPAFCWTWPIVFLGQFTVALCFAELAARYPLSGGIYQWSRRVGPRSLGWMTGWVYLAGSIISLAAVAMALQGTLPQISSTFQFTGDSTNRLDAARNAVLLGAILVFMTTVINVIGIRLMARINNVGVIAELIGVALLIVLLALRVRRGPAILFDSLGRGELGSTSYLRPFLAAALMASYVLYGFDTAGTLAEETDDPRRRAPWAILQALGAAGFAGGLLILMSILSVPNPAGSALGQISGGLPLLVKDVLGAQLGTVLLIEVVFAISVCALAVHAGSVRLMFAMARDGNLPFARSLSHVSPRTKTPIVPAVVIGVLAVLVLVANINFPHVIEMLCSVAIIWANLAYLLVTLPLLVVRLRRTGDFLERPTNGGSQAKPSRRLFSLGPMGLPINLLAVIWGLFLIINISWPRAEIYGDHPWGRWAAPIATVSLLTAGLFYRGLRGRSSRGIVAEHRSEGALTIDRSDHPLEPCLIGPG